MELICCIQNYDWGKLGLNSRVALLRKNIDESFQVQSNKPYAELWMGDHINGPSWLKETNEPLSRFIQQHPDILGPQATSRHLPFLFKVLSIEKPLSIQTHPDKTNAEFLHKAFPEIYKDDNHKPELAIALTPFQAMCGFRKTSEIQSFLSLIPELVQVVGTENASQFLQDGNTENLKQCFTTLMNRKPIQIANNLQNLLARFKTLDDENRFLHAAHIVERLYSYFPDDVGCFSVYFLNIINLKPKEAIYLGANVPHAYLSGDCIECMACSDNVIRAGLTPKYKDVTTLCQLIDYSSLENVKFLPVVETPFINLYQPPVPDFAVAHIEVPAKIKTFTLPKRSCASILLVIEGKGTFGDVILKAGRVLFIPSKKIVEMEIEEDLVMFQALGNINFKPVCACSD